MAIFIENGEEEPSDDNRFPDRSVDRHNRIKRFLDLRNVAHEERRITPQYICGAKAYDKGFVMDDCPWPLNQPREAENRSLWFHGWLDRRTEIELGPIFAKYGVA